MTTIADPTDSKQRTRLVIPDVSSISLHDAALAYAKAGMHVLPVASGKHPGSIVGKGWPQKSTTDPETIAQWWEDHPDSGIAIHTGPSQLTFFDIDTDTVPEELAWLKTGIVQFSRAEAVNSERGHYGFFTGTEIFTSSDLKTTDGTKVGEIRSGNTVIIAAPSPHVHAKTKNAQYRWRTGDFNRSILALPGIALKFLRPLTVPPGRGGGALGASATLSIEASTFDVKKALREWIGNDRPNAKDGLIADVRSETEQTRNSTRNALRILASEARIGLYPLKTAVELVKAAMIRSYEARGESEKFSEHEFDRLVRNGVGYALSRSESEILDEANRDYGVQETDDEEDFEDFEEAVAREVRRLEVREEAKRRIEDTSRVVFSRSPTNLKEFLAQPPNRTPMRIDKVMPDCGRVIFSAPYKAGKTTVVGNLIRSLVDAKQFLDEFTVYKPAKRLVLIDNELSADMVRDWLFKQNIRNTDAVVDVICLRGEVSLFDILSDKRRGEWATYLSDLGCDYLIFDCLRPVLDALGLDENHDAGKFLSAFDALLSEACTNGDACVVHHMGHANERSRGDSRIQDWPDAIWKLVRENPENEFSPRYFSATGRDVEVAQGRLKYNPATRHLSYENLNRSEGKKQRKADIAVQEIMRILTQDKENGGSGLSQKKIEEEAMKKPNVAREAIRYALKTGIESEELVCWNGARNAKMYTIGPKIENDD